MLRGICLWDTPLTSQKSFKEALFVGIAVSYNLLLTKLFCPYECKFYASVLFGKAMFCAKVVPTVITLKWHIGHLSTVATPLLHHNARKALLTNIVSRYQEYQIYGTAHQAKAQAHIYNPVVLVICRLPEQYASQKAQKQHKYAGNEHVAIGTRHQRLKKARQQHKEYDQVYVLEGG